MKSSTFNLGLSFWYYKLCKRLLSCLLSCFFLFFFFHVIDKKKTITCGLSQENCVRLTMYLTCRCSLYEKSLVWLGYSKRWFIRCPRPSHKVNLKRRNKNSRGSFTQKQIKYKFSLQESYLMSEVGQLGEVWVGQCLFCDSQIQHPIQDWEHRFFLFS